MENTNLYSDQKLELQKKTVDSDLEAARDSLTRVKDSNRTFSDTLHDKNEELKKCKEDIKECESSIAELKNLQVAITQLIPQIENEVYVLLFTSRRKNC